MHSAGAVLSIPSTPVSCRINRSLSSNPYAPLSSSPLASPDTPTSSPVASAQARRRRSQYKAATPVTPARTHSSAQRVPELGRSGGSIFRGGRVTSGSTPGEDPQKAFLREKFRMRCIERAARARENAVKARRYAALSDPSSDGFEDMMDEDDVEEDDEEIMGSEFFRRIVQNAARQGQHSYRVSFQRDVGSSFDPDLEDIDQWEHELYDETETESSGTMTADCIPDDLEVEELEAYAEEYARQMALAEFEDIPEEELFSWSDVDELSDMKSAQDDDVVMEH